tara:strand:+ start:1489 stop:3063 length:1575 start_codon:yes stop_codon:yes gene_type:complete
LKLVDTETILAPISENSPAGVDARYEFCYEMMEAEVKKFGSLFGETVDWQIVKLHSLEVLIQHSKDLKALCYLIRSMVEESGTVGLEEGLSLLNDSISQFGNELYPRRKRGRDGAVEWLNHQFKLVFATLANETHDWQVLSSCMTLTEGIQRQFDDIFQDSDVDFFELKAHLNQLQQTASFNEEALEQDGVLATDKLNSVIALTEPTVVAQSYEPGEATVPTMLNSNRTDADLPNTIDVDTDFSSPSASKRTLKKVSEIMVHSNPSEPLGYRIYRYLTWADIDGLPDHKDNVTPLSLAVSLDQQTEYRDKANQESDIDTVKHLERTLTDAPFWLTGHYFVYLMLDNLGYDEAALAVKQETKRFVEAFEGIETLYFKNSIPFADEETITWLSLSNDLPSGKSSIIHTSIIEEDDLPKMENIALADLGKYVAELSKKLESDNSGRGQFMLHLKLVKAYQCVGLYPLCLPYLEKNWAISEELNLSNWEPHLSLSLENLIHKTLKELYQTKATLPVRYCEWEKIYDQQ